jgi:hypothetical protein
MTKRIELYTTDAVMIAIGQAKTVFVQVRFGTSERWVKISKIEARELIESVAGLTTEQAEMYGGTFGTWSGRHLYLG